MWCVRYTSVACAALTVLLLACGTPAPASPPAPAAAGASAPASAPARADAPPAPTAPTKVTVCLPSHSDTILPGAAAEYGGYYQQQHVEADIQYFAGGLVDSALAAGQCDFVFGAGGVGPLLQGVDVVVVAAAVNFSPAEIWGRDPVRTIADLKGRSLGTTGPGSLTWRVGRYYLQLNGLTPEVDVTVRSLGDSASTLGALLSGQLDAAVMYSPDTFVARREGLHLVYKATDVPMINTALVTTRHYLDANRPVVVGMVKAVTDTLARLKSDQAFYASAREQFTQQTIDPAEVPEYWQAAAEVYSIPPRGTHEGAVTALRFYAETAGDQDLDALARNWLDMSIVDQLYPPGASR